ncbi:MAG: hypothetical protein ACFE9L_07235 [Candidatus Hodarchaeota archaeon]
MPRKTEKEITITESSVEFRKTFFLFILFSTVLYFLFLVFLEIFRVKYTREYQESILILDISLLVLILLNILITLFVHLRLVPRARQIKEPFHRFGIHTAIFILGIQPFCLLGLFIGIITLLSGSINWRIVCLFFLIGFLHGGFLYVVEIAPSLRACEIGKIILNQPVPQPKTAQNIKSDY